MRTGFSNYSTLRRWVYAKCRPGLKKQNHVWWKSQPTLNCYKEKIWQ